MAGIVTADFIIGSNSQLTRQELDKIVQVLNIRDSSGRLLRPPIGANCTYKLVLQKTGQDVPGTRAKKKPGGGKKKP